MSKVGLIIGREYASRVRKKSFLIMTFLGPVLFAAVMIGGVVAATSETTFHSVLVVDDTGLAAHYREQGRLFQDSDNLRYQFSSDTATVAAFDESPYTLYLEMTHLIVDQPSTNLYYKDYPSGQVQEKIRNDLEGVIERERLKKHEISYSDYQAIKTHADLRLIDNDDESGEASNRELNGGIGVGFAVLIYMFIFIYGVQVMRGVIEEKTSRVVEVLVSSVKPFQLMLGKIIGIGLVGLTQFVMWVILCAVVMGVAQSMLLDFATAAPVDGALPVNAINPAEVLDDNSLLAALMSVQWGLFLSCFVFYFLGGFLLYGSIFAAIGAAVDSETDSQQFMIPVTVPLIFAYMISIFLVVNPEGSAGVVFSMVPLTSPVVMMVRLAMGMDGNMWQLAVSMILLIATFLGTVWLAGKIYRTGILMYGKKATYRELWKWLFYKA